MDGPRWDTADTKKPRRPPVGFLGPWHVCQEWTKMKPALKSFPKSKDYYEYNIYIMIFLIIISLLLQYMTLFAAITAEGHRLNPSPARSKPLRPPGDPVPAIAEEHSHSLETQLSRRTTGTDRLLRGRKAADRVCEGRRFISLAVARSNTEPKAKEVEIEDPCKKQT